MTQIDWLERLDAATDYGELQALFSAIASEAWATADGQQLAASIDEAIRRIEQERLRDEDELAAFERTYDSFKAQQRGVIGWFKRRIPFTETRRQEAGHRDAISDQQAEILADNLVIARAQMLKEQLSSPAQRRLGVAPAEWRRRFDQHSSVSPALAHAKSQLEEATRPYATAKSRVDAATQDAERARREMEDVQQQLDDLEDLRIELESVSDSARSAVGRVLPRLSCYLESLWPLSRNSSLPSLGQLELPRFDRRSMEVETHRDIHGHTRDSRIVRAARQDLDEFARTLQRESSDLRRSLDANLEQHQAAWRARCRELFGESMAAEVCAYQL